MTKYCPNCRSKIASPSTSEISKYAKYWEDNRCYICNIILVETTNSVKCPSCGSSDFSSHKKGYDVGKGILGALLSFNVIGLLYGADNKGKVEITCLNCGYTWSP